MQRIFKTIFVIALITLKNTLFASDIVDSIDLINKLNSLPHAQCNSCTDDKNFFNSNISEKQLLKLISGLQLAVKLKYKTILLGGNLRFGNAQKIVNLYLKNMWIAGWIKTPPHFPIDRIIQNKFQKIVPWTNMNRTEYFSIIFEAKNHMIKDGYKNLATWELNKYFESYIEQ